MDIHRIANIVERHGQPIYAAEVARIYGAEIGRPVLNADVYQTLLKMVADGFLARHADKQYSRYSFRAHPPEPERRAPYKRSIERCSVGTHSGGYRMISTSVSLEPWKMEGAQ